MRDFTPDLEVYSIDEAFLSFEGFTELDAHARTLRATVLQWTGIPVSVGIAPTKTLAKVANRTAKKDPRHDGVCILMEPGTGAPSRNSSLRICGAWRSELAARLEALGINTPLQLRDADPALLREHMGVVMERMALELRGTPCQALRSPFRTTNRSLRRARSAGPSPAFTNSNRPSRTYARAAEKLRRQDLVAGVVMVFVTTNPFKPQDPQYAAQRSVDLPVATADTLALKGPPCSRRASVARRLSLQEGGRHAAGSGSGSVGAGRFVDGTGFTAQPGADESDGPDQRLFWPRDDAARGLGHPAGMEAPIGAAFAALHDGLG